MRRRHCWLPGLSLLIMATLYFCSQSFAVGQVEKPVSKRSTKGEVKMEKAYAIFAGGCFWCMEPPFDKHEGVFETISGYSGGDEKNPTYKQVSAGQTGHAEVIKVVYNPKKISYQQLLDIFWMQIDPTVVNRQFNDVGRQYRTGIYYQNDEERKLAEASKKKLMESGRFDKPIATEIVAAGEFYAAEDYHQDYYQKNPIRYKFYRRASGRDNFIKKHWSEKK